LSGFINIQSISINYQINTTNLFIKISASYSLMAKWQNCG